MPVPVSTTATTTATPFAFVHALDSVKGELLLVPEKEVMPIRLDIPTVVTAVLGAAPEVQRYRSALVAVFGEADTAIIDRLELLARATGQAHTRYLAASGGSSLEALAKTVSDTRAHLVTEAKALMHRGVLEENALDGLVGGQAYRDQAFDVHQLVDIFLANEAAFGRFTALSRADVEQASADAEAFLTALGIRNQPDSGKLEAQLRDRAYTVLVRTYDEVRRLLAFLRWEEGDADRIAPSLFAGRSARKREAVPTGDMPTEESASPLAPPPATPVRPGLPGADPFVRS